MTRIRGLVEMCQLTTRENDKSDACDDKSDFPPDERLSKASRWERNGDDEMYGDADQ